MAKDNHTMSPTEKATDTIPPICITPGWFAAICIALFFIGILLGFAILVCMPSFYRRLEYLKKHMGILCCYCGVCQWRTSPVPNTHKQQQQQPRPVTETVRYYSEIDEIPLPLHPQENNGHTGKSYEDVRPDKTENRYSDLETKADKYEDVSQPTASRDPVQPEAQPIYHILEPNTYKRLPVRLYTESVAENDNNVYFILEPGSNHVKPTFEAPKRNSDHTYFVLEPNNLPQETSPTQAYAVSDLNDSHSHFILEKTF